MAQPETVYMAVLNSRRHQWTSRENPVLGAFVSKDGGTTWEHRGWRQYIRTFYTEEGPDGTIWSACGNGVLRSTDGGRTWRVTTGWEVTEVLKVKVDPGNPKRVYAATAYGIIVSSDRGESWNVRNTGLPRTFTSDICIDRTDGTHVLAATEVGVYESADAGLHWERCGGQPFDIRTIVQHPRNPLGFWAGTEEHGVLQTVDGGRTWIAMNKGLTHTTVYAIAFDPTNPRFMYLGTHDGGVYRSTDGGDTWLQSGVGITSPDVHAVVVLPSNSNTVLAGTLNGGLFKSTDGGASWEFNSQPEAQVWGLSVRRSR